MMRIIGGQYRSRKLKSVPGIAVRPTPDRLREALFNVLAPRIAGAVFLDAYAGGGAVGIEALSRGAKQIVLIERNPQAFAVLRENLATLQVGSEAVVMRGSAVSQLRKRSEDLQLDIAFVDPPYELVTEYTDCLTILAEMNCPLVIAQHPSRLVLEEGHGALVKGRVLRQGDNALSFYEAADSGLSDHGFSHG
jgi:16S rRNA (guanine(966)-N(2))-methyltransferase RsmD